MAVPKKRNLLNLIQVEKSGPASEAELLLERLLQSGYINPSAFEALPKNARASLAHHEHIRQMLARLVEYGLLTSYQADRIQSGNLHGLILGSYRVLDRLGVGNCGVVFRGEHRETGQKVAIKVLIPARDRDTKSMLRFFAERKTIAQLSHPGIVRALDVGETTSTDPDEPVLYYYVMEHVPGQNLEQQVRQNGPMKPNLACEVAYQVADALTEAHKHHLVHRDIEPANILVTPEGRAVLLDFGLVRQFQSRQTEPGSLVGILEWIAPEQLQDAHTVDIRADIFSLGCTLFWCLTGQSPRGLAGNAEAVRGAFQKEKPRGAPAEEPELPRTARDIQKNITPELNAVVVRMMAPLPDDRYPDPEAVMAALAPFVSEKYARAAQVAQPDAGQALRDTEAASATVEAKSCVARILIVDDDQEVCRLCREALQNEQVIVDECRDGASALQAATAAAPDLVLLDVEMPETPGLEVLKQLRQAPRGVNQKIIMLADATSNIPPLLAAGVDDYLIKPIDTVLLKSRVKTALLLKESQDAHPQRPPAPAPALAPVEVVPEVPPTFWQRLLGQKQKTKAPDSPIPISTR
jgi:serine/threonine protein kinase/CheY-like chemotaxis protein